jgi:hypothetical protein
MCFWINKALDRSFLASVWFYMEKIDFVKLILVKRDFK